MNKIVLSCKVINGKLTNNVSNDIKQFIIANEGKFIELSLQRKRSKRSDLQNKFYWGAIIPIIQNAFKDLGYRITKEETHDILREKFLSQDAISKDGEVVAKIRVSTTTLTKSEFGNYIDEIVQWSAETLDCIIPEPNSQAEITF